MSAITHRDRPMHGVRKVAGGRLWWWGYFRWTNRTYYLWGIPICVRAIDKKELPITDLIKRACCGL